MSSTGVDHWTDVLEVFGLCRHVTNQLVALSGEERELAVHDLVDFFAVMMTMIYSPIQAYELYGSEVSGLGDLRSFLRSQTSTLRITWRHTTFRAAHGEFGGVEITALKPRKRRKNSA